MTAFSGETGVAQVERFFAVSSNFGRFRITQELLLSSQLMISCAVPYTKCRVQNGAGKHVDAAVITHAVCGLRVSCYCSDAVIVWGVKEGHCTVDTE